MCNQFTLHHEIRIDIGRTKFGQKKQTVFFTSVDPMNKELKDPNIIDLEAPRLPWSEKVEETSKHGVLGRHQTCSNERI